MVHFGNSQPRAQCTLAVCLAVCRRVAGRQAEAYREEARARGFGDGAWMAHVRARRSFATVLKHCLSSETLPQGQILAPLIAVDVLVCM